MEHPIHFCYLSIFLRWQGDVRCVGPFPRNYESYERTLRDIRSKRFGPSPTTVREIEVAFTRREVFSDLGISRAGGTIYNGVQIEDGFSNCIFSSPQSILLAKQNLETDERFFLMDVTFRVTPREEFQQVLIIYIKYGIKVRTNHVKNERKFIENKIMIKTIFHFLDLPVSMDPNDKTNDWSLYGRIEFC